MNAQVDMNVIAKDGFMHVGHLGPLGTTNIMPRKPYPVMLVAPKGILEAKCVGTFVCCQNGQNTLSWTQDPTAPTWRHQFNAVLQKLL